MPQQAINTIRLVLVDDHEVVRIGLRTLLDRIGFDYRPATYDSMFRHPSKLRRARRAHR